MSVSPLAREFHDFTLRMARGDTRRMRAIITRPSGLEATATVVAGVVTAVTVVLGTPQSGEALTAVPTVRIVDPLGVGTGATATATVVGGVLTAIAVTAGGSGYSTAVLPYVVVAPVDLSAAEMTFTAKRDLTSDTYVFKLTSSGGSIEAFSGTGGIADITIPPEATNTLDDWPNLYADFQVIEVDGTTSTPLRGRVTISPDASTPVGVATPFDDGSDEDDESEPFAAPENSLLDLEYLAHAQNMGGNPGASPRDRPFQKSDISTFDAGVLQDGLGNFQLAAFDGRRVYFFPYGVEYDEPGPSSDMLVHDSFLDFEDAGSYRVVNLNDTLGLTGTDRKACGYLGGCMDSDGWLYFAPFMESATLGMSGILHQTIGNSLMLRFDTSREVDDPAAYERFDLKDLPVPPAYFGWCNCLFDGRYVYWSPVSDPGGSSAANHHHGNVIRYDTTLAFANTAAWEVFDISTINAGLIGFQGLVTDGRAVYFVPFKDGTGVGARSGRIARFLKADDEGTPYDLDDTNAWQHYNLEGGGAAADNVAYDGAVYDGRFIYLVPWGSGSSTMQLGRVARFDTLGPVQSGATHELDSPNNWSFFDLTTLPFDNTISAENRCRGYQWGWFAYPYVYFGPSVNSVNPVGGLYPRVPPYVRYDVRQRFDDAASWATIDYGDVAAVLLQNICTGAAHDGRYAYMSPYGSRDNPSAKIWRIYSPTVEAVLGDDLASSNLFVDARGYVGVHTKTPVAPLSVVLGGSTTGGTVPAFAFKNATVTVNVLLLETTLMTTTLPASTFSQTGTLVRFKAFGAFAANANTKALAVYLGGSIPPISGDYTAIAVAGVSLVGAGAVALFPAVAHNGGSWKIEGEIIRRSSTNLTYSVTATAMTAAGATTTRHVQSSVTTLDPANPLPLTITGTSGTAGSDIVHSGMWVEVAL